MQVSEQLRKSTAGYTHWCPGCGCAHHIAVDQPNPNGAVWWFDRNLNKPSFSPSVFFQYHDQQGRPIGTCHYNLVAGLLAYQSDCTHSYAGQAIELPALPPGMRDKE
jgi:hypothetical protein